jgi:hypothetical protein
LVCGSFAEYAHGGCVVGSLGPRRRSVCFGASKNPSGGAAWKKASGPGKHGGTPEPLSDDCIPATSFGGGSAQGRSGGWSKATWSVLGRRALVRVARHHPRAPVNRSIQGGFRGFELSVRSTLQPSITLLVRYRFRASVLPWDGSRSLVQTAVSSRSTQGSRGAHRLSGPTSGGSIKRDCHPRLCSRSRDALTARGDPQALVRGSITPHIVWLVHESRSPCTTTWALLHPRVARDWGLGALRG